jgi:rod shape-determining protein MreB
LNEPSVVAVSEQDNRILAVGNEAKDMIGKTPDSIIAYRPMRDGVIADYRVTEAMLRYYINKALKKWDIFRPEVMISVPAGITSTERRAVIEAAIRAGAKNAYVVKEPILAAIGAGIPIYEACGHMVADIGGGTTDVAVISLGGIVAATSVKCAGNKIDQAIADYIKKTFNLAIGDQMAEEIKMRIGSAMPMEEELVMTIKGRDFLTGLPKTAELTTNEVVKSIAGELDQITKAIKDVLQNTPPELAADIIDHGITMTGGTSLLRNIAEVVFRRTGVRATVAEDALFCVAKGTGIAIEHLEVYKKSVISK